MPNKLFFKRNAQQMNMLHDKRQKKENNTEHFAEIDCTSVNIPHADPTGSKLTDLFLDVLDISID